jgi:hypothetical protein
MDAGVVLSNGFFVAGLGIVTIATLRRWQVALMDEFLNPRVAIDAGQFAVHRLFEDVGLDNSEQHLLALHLACELGVGVALQAVAV